MAKTNPAFAQIVDHRRPMLPMTDGIKSAVVAGAHAGQAMAVGKAPGLDAETQITENNEAVLRGEETPQQQPEIEDATLNWGRMGQVESTKERGQPEMPTGAASATGFGSVESAGTTSPNPSTLGTELRPVSGSGGSGNWNMSKIANYEIGG
jgi:hypothetical protein